jgi:hypothetical protein
MDVCPLWWLDGKRSASLGLMMMPVNVKKIEVLNRTRYGSEEQQKGRSGDDSRQDHTYTHQEHWRRHRWF